MSFSSAAPAPEFKHLLSQARSAAGLAQYELAYRIGCHPTTLALWERGATTPVVHQEIRVRKLAIALRLSVDEINASIQRSVLLLGPVRRGSGMTYLGAPAPLRKKKAKKRYKTSFTPCIGVDGVECETLIRPSSLRCRPCSDKFRRKPECGNGHPLTGDNRHCKQCARDHSAAKRRALGMTPLSEPRECDICGDEFIATAGSQKRCSETCRKAYHQQYYRARKAKKQAMARSGGGRQPAP